MRVRILRNVARRPEWTEGAELVVTDAEAADLLKRGLCEMLDPVKATPAKAVEAVPSKPTKAISRDDRGE